MIKELLQGAIVGIANIIPGVSGGTMLAAMGCYDTFISSLTHLTSNFKKSIRFLLPILIGAGLAVVVLARVFEYLLAFWPIPTNLAFCGLIAGSLPAVYKPAAGKKISVSCLACFLVFFVMVTSMAFFKEGSGMEKTLGLNVFNAAVLFLIGIIAAATMVIPGVSGSMVLMLLGYYQPILSLINTFIEDLRLLNISGLLTACGLLVPFGLGVVIGIFAIAKVVEWVFSLFPLQATWAILGLVAASPIAILLSTDWAGFTWWIFLIGIVCFLLGAFAASKLSE